jgi:hypothetical protein
LTQSEAEGETEEVEEENCGRRARRIGDEEKGWRKERKERRKMWG